MTPTRSALAGLVIATAGAAAVPAAAADVPPYRGRAVDRLPAGMIQNVVFEVENRTTKDGRPTTDEPSAINQTLRFESWNSRTRGRMAATLVGGRLIGHDGVEVPLGGTVDEHALSGDTCRRWEPASHVVTRWRCTGVNDRNTAVLEHNETGLQHHLHHRARSFYAIRRGMHGGRRVVTFRSTARTPDREKVVGTVPDGAPDFRHRRSVRTARLLASSRRLLSDRTRDSFTMDGHAYVRVSVTRVLSRELLPETARNRRVLAPRYPGATVKRGPATHERIR